jgi:hypothetical protein
VCQQQQKGLARGSNYFGCGNSKNARVLTTTTESNKDNNTNVKADQQISALKTQVRLQSITDSS